MHINTIWHGREADRTEADAVGARGAEAEARDGLVAEQGGDILRKNSKYRRRPIAWLDW